MPSDARERLAEQQRLLVECLTGGSTAPKGFDARQVATAAHSLLRKRARGVARTWPALARSLGDEFGDQFAGYAMTHDQPAAGYQLDGEQFVLWLSRQVTLSNDARIEWLRRGAMRGWPVKISRGTGGGWILALRIWRRVRVWPIRLR